MKTILIANRGEIAVRIVRACRELGIESVAVCSEADRHAPHVVAADRSVTIGAAPALESYLSIPTIMEAVRATGADAVHPGYGFLSESPSLARACEDAGVTWIGPPSDVIEHMGSKIHARGVMERAGVPVVPGETPADQSDAGVRQALDRVGLPALIKASAGGGGKGMRRILQGEAIDDAIGAARREAAQAFGDGTLYVERLIQHARHVEVQILADQAGHTVHLFERECSVQRRHQKVIEETPAPGLSAVLRQRMTEAGVSAARAAGYRNAGTIEFLVDSTSSDDPSFFFLEMNTRLQVEHPVTEAVVGVDLVRAQILVAAGEPLPWTQAQLSQRGHAIEARLYAEDPARGFLPQAGSLALYREPQWPGVRIDSGVREGDAVTVHYDPLLAKIIAYGETREAAIARLTAALQGFAVLGVPTNLPYLLRILGHARYRRGELDTTFLEDEAASLLAVDTPLDLPGPVAAALELHRRTKTPTVGTTTSGSNPWDVRSGWRP